MDVFLLTASCSLSIYLPKRLFYAHSQTAHPIIGSAFGLSMGMISLGIMDAVPPTWLLILSQTNAPTNSLLLQNFLTITSAYWLLLWITSCFVLLVVPCVAGSEATRMISIEASEFFAKFMPWWCLMAYRIVYFALQRFIGVIARLCSPKKAESVLAMTYNNLDGTHSQTQVTRKEQIRQLCGRISTIVWAIAPGVLGSLGVILAVRMAAPLFIQIDDAAETGSIAMVVSWLCTVGIFISALLNGFGSVSMPFTCLTGLFLEPIRPELVARAEEELQNMQNLIQSKRNDLNESGGSQSLKKKMTKNKGKGHSSFADLGGEINQRKGNLRKEITFLENLCRELAEDIDEMRHSQITASAARTTVGRFKTWMGIAFSIVLLFRLYSAGVSMWYHYTSNPKAWRIRQGDFVTRTLLWLSGHNLVSDQYFNTLSQSISLGLTVMLGVTQLRTFLRTVLTVNRRMNKFYEKCHCLPKIVCVTTSTNARYSPAGTSNSIEHSSFLGGSRSIHAHIIASLLSCYCLSCTVLTKMMVPEQYCSGFWAAIGGKDMFKIHDSAVNTIYAMSAMVSASMLAMALGIQRQNSLRYNGVGSGGGNFGAEAC